jgi:PBP1b-binding outer membrane lipoprotein LpoB
MMSIVAVLMLALVLAACGGGTPAVAATQAPAVSAETPESVAKTFVEATFSGNIDSAKTVVCAAMAAELTDEAAAAMSAMAEAEMDFSGLTFTASDVTDTTATVTVSGILKMTMAGVTQDMDFSDMGPGAAFPLVKEGGARKVCQVTG